MPSQPSTDPSAPATPPSDPSAPDTPDGTTPADEFSPDFDLASSFDGAGDSQAIAPNMIGDNFGAGGSTATVFTNVFPFGGIIANARPMGGNQPVTFVDLLNHDYVSVNTLDEINQTFNGNSNAPIAIASTTEPVPPGFSLVGADVAFDNAGTNPPAGNRNLQAGDQFLVSASFGQQVQVILPSSGGSGGVVGRQKVTENNSPIPRDRIFFNFNYFNNVPLTLGGVNVKRFTPGFEKTIFSPNFSLEFRAPFASTLDSSVSSFTTTNGDSIQLGNMTIVGKYLFYEGESLYLSTGMAINLPTAADITAGVAGGAPLVEIQNESWHLQPFLAGLYAPDDRFFFQGFAQVDFGLKENSVFANTNGNGLAEVGSLDDLTVFFLDLSMGYWIYRNNDRGALITGLAPMIESHFGTTIGDHQSIQSGNLTINQGAGSITNLNITTGLVTEINQNSDITFAVVTPAGGDDQQFDFEVGVLFNSRFGASRR